jgi:hypothetical protein
MCASVRGPARNAGIVGLARSPCTVFCGSYASQPDESQRGKTEERKTIEAPPPPDAGAAVAVNVAVLAFDVPVELAQVSVYVEVPTAVGDRV